MEMAAGFLALDEKGRSKAAWFVADQGEAFLNERYGQRWEFVCAPDTKNHMVEVQLWNRGKKKLVLEEKIENFISEALLTKVMLVCG